MPTAPSYAISDWKVLVGAGATGGEDRQAGGAVSALCARSCLPGAELWDGRDRGGCGQPEASLGEGQLSTMPSVSLQPGRACPGLG